MTTKVDEIRAEVLRHPDSQIEYAEYEIKSHLQWVEQRVADARREMENADGSRPTNGSLLRNSSTWEIDLTAARCAALKSARREVLAIIDWVARKEE